MTKAQRLKWNTDVVGWLSAELDFEVIYHSEFHFSLTHPIRGRMDYWPSTNKIGWFHKGKMYGRPIVIEDIEQYLMENFKTKT